MSNLGEAMRAAVDEHVGEVLEWLIPRETPDLGTLVELFGGEGTRRVNARIAEAGGYGGPRDNRRGSAGWVRRRTFMRDLQRYRAAEGRQRRRPVERGRLPELRRIARAEQRRRATLEDASAVLDAMGRHGVTMTHVKGRFSYQPHRRREIEVTVAIEPDVFDEVDWPGAPAPADGDAEAWDHLGRLLLEAWGIAYGMPDSLTRGGGMSDDESVELGFSMGADPRAAYGYGAA